MYPAVQGCIPTRTRRNAILAAFAAAFLASLIFVLAAEQASANPTKIVGRTFTLKDANDTPRLTVACPGNKRFHFPYGGGMYSTTPYDPDGEGVYPHSYERLGQQHGYHVTPVLYDPSKGSTTPRNVTLQVICGPEPGKLNPPHETATVNPGESKTHNVRCTGKRKILGGGFQRTDFTGLGGDFVTESFMSAPNVWTVSGTAFGTFGGELTGIAYCRRQGGTVAVSSSVEVPPHTYGAAATQPCPGAKVVTWTGFQTNPKGSIFYAGSNFGNDDTVTGFGFNNTDGPATLTTYGYCNRVR
jgi:hypothetical protein